MATIYLIELRLEQKEMLLFLNQNPNFKHSVMAVTDGETGKKWPVQRLRQPARRRASSSGASGAPGRRSRPTTRCRKPRRENAASSRDLALSRRSHGMGNGIERVRLQAKAGPAGDQPCPESRTRRIEDRYGVGILDLLIKLPGVPAFWAEGKVIKDNVFGPTQSQFEEGLRWIEAGVQAVLIGWHHGAIISPWKQKADRRECLRSVGVDHVKALQEFMR